MKYLNQKGDTIVEVLLAIAIVSAVLGGAFVSVNNSYVGTRQSQERGEALKLLEGQLERLKEASRSSATDVYTGPNPFCIIPNPAPLPASPLLVVADSNAGCQQGSRYRLSIRRGSDGSTFTARATWPASGSTTGAQDEVTLTYRVYNDED